MFALHDNAHFQPRNMFNGREQRNEGNEASFDGESVDEMDIPEENVVAMQASDNSIHYSEREENLVVDLLKSTNKCNSNDLQKQPDQRDKDIKEKELEKQIEEHKFSIDHQGPVYSEYGLKSMTRSCGIRCGQNCEYETQLVRQLNRLQLKYRNRLEHSI